MDVAPPNADERALERLDRMAHLLDARLRIPGTGWRIGIDGLVGLIPGIGDLATTVLSLYIIGEAARHGLPRTRLLRMGWNVAVDTVIGTIPVVGDLFDIGWKANRRNVDLLRDTLQRRRDTSSGG